MGMLQTLDLDHASTGKVSLSSKVLALKILEQSLQNVWGQ